MQQHKRTDSNGSGRKISFNLENKIFPITSDRPVTAPTFKTPATDLRIELPNYDFAPKVPSPLTYEHPVRIEYKRTLSVKADRQERAKFGHRRTQSCTTPSSPSLAQQQVRKSSDLRKMPYNRSSSNIANTREYYAAPAYNEASLLERKESLRNSTRAKAVVE